ncbi:MAG: hypothetical protein PHQ80_01810 [Candidatus ainarchaeum sp.]|nr:hypothetical protein [Candidatus ainarchaeum sp.]MDD5096284.1 hypothetical protein [Candidatus ainarchaeum sp.]
MQKLLLCSALMLLLFGCISTTPLKDLNERPADFVGEKISVSGTVENSIRLGTLSSYTLVDGNESIRVSSQSLPAEGGKETVTGTWMRDTLFGYYLLAEE